MLAIESKTTVITPEVRLECGGGYDHVTGIACVSNRDLIVVSTLPKIVYAYEYTTQGEPIRTFEKHKSKVHGSVHLCDDIVASVD